MSEPAPCLDDELIAAMAAGEIDDGEREAISVHVDGCPSCRALIAGLARDGVLATPSSVLSPALSLAATGEEQAGLESGTHLGRYRLVRSIGQGGMGELWLADDPDLDRRVALKLLRGHLDGDDSYVALLRREARALARLSHPNVVAVYEVGEAEGRDFIAMEYVAGVALDEWLVAAEHDWREVVRVFAAAGRGLAAAHEAGVIHRDFKPSNVLVGSDGRVRVSDFGLARLGAEHAWSSAAPDAASGVTTTAGTPAYMSPEQLTGAELAPAADQFAFCASLYEALYGRRPFARDERDPARRAREPDAGPVPRRLWAVIQRGLSTEPGERFDDMLALVEAIERDPARVRRRRLGLAVAVVVPALAAAWLARGDAAVEPCTGAQDRISSVWNGDVRARIRAAMVGSGAYGEKSWARIAPSIDDYGTRWREGYREACMSHERGEQSAAMLDRRMTCLERRRSELAATVSLLATSDRDAAGDPVRLVLSMSAVEDCADSARLAARSPLPADPAARARAEAIEARIAEATVLDAAGRYGDAAEQAHAIAADADAEGLGRLAAEARLIEGRAHVLGGRSNDAIAPLRKAELGAIAATDNQVAAEAVARRLYAQAMQSPPEASWIRDQIAMGDALLAVDGKHAIAALLRHNAGSAMLARGEPARARELFLEARARRPEGGALQVELLSTDRAIVFGETDLVARSAQYRELVEKLGDILGPLHPMTLDAHISLAVEFADADAVRAELADVCPVYAEHHPRAHGSLAMCWFQLGLGQDGDVAASSLERAAVSFDASGQRNDARVAAAYALIARGRLKAARVALDELLASYTDRAELPWYQWRIVGLCELGRARVAAAEGRADDARRLAATAVGVWIRVVEANPSQLWKRRLEEARALETALGSP